MEIIYNANYFVISWILMELHYKVNIVEKITENNITT